MAGIELCKFTHGLGVIFEFYPERKRGLKSKNIKAQPMCKFARGNQKPSMDDRQTIEKLEYSKVVIRSLQWTTDRQ